MNKKNKGDFGWGKWMVLTIITFLLLAWLTLPYYVRLTPTAEVASSYRLSTEVKEAIDKEEYDDAVDMARRCESLVANELQFSFKSKAQRQDYEQNCVGYAAMLNAACNYAFRQKGTDARCSHVRGTAEYLGIDLCEILGQFSPFFKDHDFCIVKYGDRTLTLDASLYDLTHF